MAKTELDQLYVFGFGYQVTDNVLARVSYDRMNLALRNPYVGDQSRYKSSLDTVKLGAVYSF